MNAITENTSRLGARIQESILEHTRDLALSRSAAVSYFDAPEEKVRNIRKQLDTSSDREKLDALKTLIALISKGRNVSEYFAAVVKNVASPNLEIRKLVYIYLLRYAEVEPDLALLSINTFQRDLADANPLIRAMALRVLSGINVPMVENIVILAVKKCSADPSPYVRKAAALAVIKCHKANASQDSLVPIVMNLLKERSPLSIGAVAVAFLAVCPTRLDLLHSHYRRLCRMLIDADAWGQVNLLDLLARYARSMLSKPFSAGITGSASGLENTAKDVIDSDLQLLLTNSEPLFMSQNPAVVMAVARLYYYLAPSSHLSKVVDPLLRLLPVSPEIERATLPNLYTIVCDAPQLFQIHYPRFIIRTTDTREIKSDKLRILVKLITTDNYQILLREFAVYGEDHDADIASKAIKAIGRCAKLIPDAVPESLTFLMDFIKKGTGSAAAASVLVLKSLVQDSLQQNADPSLATASTLASALGIISDLAQRLDEIKHPSARACVIWLVGQYATEVDGSESEGGPAGIAWWAPDVLRRVAKTFATEEPIVKLQVLTLAAKLQVLCSNDDHILTLLSGYVFSLARYDTNFDVRDRARMLSALLSGVSPHLQHTNGGNYSSWEDRVESDQGGVILRREQVKVVLFQGKLGVHEENDIPDVPSLFGSMQVIIGKQLGLESGLRLPDWPDEGTDSSLRDVEEEYPSVPVTMPGLRATNVGAGSATGFGSSHMSSNSVTPVVLTPTSTSPNLNQGGTGPGGKGTWTDLDKFYEESEEESSEDEDDESEEEEEEEESETRQLTEDSKPPDSHGHTLKPGREESEESAESDDSDDSDDSSE